MKKFKEFLKGKKSEKPTLITAQPVHGSHAKETEKKVNEEWHEVGSWLEKHDNDHLGENPERVHKKLNMSHEDFKSHPGSSAVSTYTSASGYTNGELIKKASGHTKVHSGPMETEKAKEIRERRAKAHHEQVKGLDAAVHHKPLEHDLHVYHGTDRFHPGEEAAKNKNNKIHLPAYTSTSINKGTAHEFSDNGSSPHGQHIIHIHLKKGQKGMYVGTHSIQEHEKEMILPRDTKLKIHPKPTKLSDGVHVWHAHVTDD